MGLGLVAAGELETGFDLPPDHFTIVAIVKHENQDFAVGLAIDVGEEI
jgi:hypothetical protein